MSKDDQRSTFEPSSDIRIIGLNTDKTRRIIGSETEYHVYFELSGSPPQVWRTLFEQEWKALNVGQPLSLHETSIDRAFLVMYCPLQEVSRYLPVLKKAAEATNIRYKQFVQNEATEQRDREDVWKNERKIVEDVAKSLHFE